MMLSPKIATRSGEAPDGTTRKISNGTSNTQDFIASAYAPPR
ncbi:MAG: hypothetical protein RLZZ522_252, partial [Verrucomicrobiota bacterium]